MTEHILVPDAATSGTAHHAAPPTPAELYTTPWVCTATSPLAATLAAGDDAGHPVSLWPTAQRSDAAQRVGRYRPDTPKHPARLLPDLAARVITQYSQPGQKVLGLFCGSGTSVVEAVYAGRDAIGLDNDRRWANVAQANLTYARDHGASGTGFVLRADARFLPDVPRRLCRSVDLLLATPPTRLTPVQPTKRPRSNEELVRLLHSDLTATLDNCAPLLRPGAIIVITTRMIHRGGQLLDLTFPIARAAEQAGLNMIERAAALRAPIRDAQLRPRTPHRPRRTRPSVIHDDVLVYQAPNIKVKTVITATTTGHPRRRDTPFPATGGRTP
jgi:16S rRNA G966 N2-methylase RsmD